MIDSCWLLLLLSRSSNLLKHGILLKLISLELLLVHWHLNRDRREVKWDLLLWWELIDLRSGRRLLSGKELLARLEEGKWSSIPYYY
jgi:hypothetical protein